MQFFYFFNYFEKIMFLKKHVKKKSLDGLK